MEKLVHLLITTESFFLNLPIKKSSRLRILNSASCHAEFPTFFCKIKDGLFAVQQASLLSEKKCMLNDVAPLILALEP